MRPLTYAYVVMSVLTFCVYAYDKYKAKKGAWRTSERTLHIMELFCGWPGALIAQKLLRHKSYKKSFSVVFWLMVVINVSSTLILITR